MGAKLEAEIAEDDAKFPLEEDSATVVAVATAGDDTSYSSLSSFPSEDLVADSSFDSYDSYADNLMVGHDEGEAQGWWETFVNTGDHSYGSAGSAESDEILLLDGSFSFHPP